MADIVLTDGSGESQTYAAPNAIGVDTADGGIALFYSEDVIPEGYTHPATHPVSMITGLSEVAKNGRFSYLLNKPFGELKTVLNGKSLVFQKLSDTCYIIKNLDPEDYLDLIAGETYSVTWDGTTYTCLCKNIRDVEELANATDDSTYLGNVVHFLGGGIGEDTGEPFFIFFGGIHTPETADEHIVSVVPVNSIHKMDVKYLPDEAATKEFVKEEIAKIETTGSSGTVDILPECQLSLVRDGSEFGLDLDADSMLFNALTKIKAGENYTVELDGTKYECTSEKVSPIIGIDTDSTEVRTDIYLGDENLTTKPFCIFAYDATQYVNGQYSDQTLAYIICASDSTEESITVTLRIYQETPEISMEEIVDYEPEEDFFALQTVDGFQEMSSYDGAYGKNYKFGDDITSFDLKLGEVYTVYWDGTEYEVEAVDASALEEGTLLLGDGSSMGLPGNGEPFTIGYVAGWGVVFLSVGETVESHTVRIYQKGTAFIKRECIPDPPFFDLTAMGLPAIPLDGTTVSVECDTSELCAALEKAPVKLSFVGNNGSVELPISMIANAFYVGGAYMMSFISLMNGTPAMFCITVTDTAISAVVVTLATASV